MSTQKKAKKSFLATGIAVMTTGVTVAVNGGYVEGGLLIAVGVGLIFAYDYMDDKVKGTPSLPDGVTEETIEAVVGVAAGQISAFADEQTTENNDTNES